MTMNEESPVARFVSAMSDLPTEPALEPIYNAIGPETASKAGFVGTSAAWDVFIRVVGQQCGVLLMTRGATATRAFYQAVIAFHQSPAKASRDRLARLTKRFKIPRATVASEAGIAAAAVQLLWSTRRVVAYEPKTLAKRTMQVIDQMLDAQVTLLKLVRGASRSQAKRARRRT